MYRNKNPGAVAASLANAMAAASESTLPPQDSASSQDQIRELHETVSSSQDQIRELQQTVSASSDQIREPQETAWSQPPMLDYTVVSHLTAWSQDHIRDYTVVCHSCWDDFSDDPELARRNCDKCGAVCHAMCLDWCGHCLQLMCGHCFEPDGRRCCEERRHQRMASNVREYTPPLSTIMETWHPPAT